MKTTFLAFILSLGLFLGTNNADPYVGKWENVSNTAPIQEVLFFADNTVKFSSRTHSLLQRYSLSPVMGSTNRFTGYFESVSLGKVVKRSTAEFWLLENDLLELRTDGKKIVLKKD